MARIWVGASGWTYASWRGTFYPDGLSSRRYLEFYAKEFPTTEVNYTFYHLPRPQTCTKWAGDVPEQFLFALKANRAITHTGRLLDVGEPWGKFIQSAKALGPHLGPILLQFPPSFKKAGEDRLANFLAMVRINSPSDSRLRLVFEFRHVSWFTDEVYRLLEEHGAALCIADSPRYPRHDVLTTDFTYYRFHGRTQLFASRYSDAELQEEAQKLKGHLRDGIEVFVYFNNDAQGHAVSNARTLRALVGE